MLGYCSDLSSVQFTRLHHLLTLLLLSNSIATYYCLAMTTSTTSTPTTSTLPAVSSLVHMENLATHANSYASARGLQIEKRTDDGISRYECAPISLLPNAYPSSAFEKAQSLAAPFNLLVDRISRDGEFLQKTLGGGVSEADPYTGKLLKLYNDIYMGEPSPANKFAREADRLGIQRSDYMLNEKQDSKEYELKQVELNTIASSFAGLACQVAALHRHLVSRFEKDVTPFLETNKQVVLGDESLKLAPSDGVPENPALQGLPKAISAAHDHYMARYFGKNSIDSVPVVLFVVQGGETNTVDQRMLEFALWEQHQVPVVRMSLQQAHTDLELDESTGMLSIKPTEDGRSKRQEVAVIYYRAGYAPTDYPDGYDGIEWQSRERMERSRATKCPSLGYHLAGTKKVQQELARVGTVERFFPDPADKAMVDNIRSAFAGLYSLGEDATEEDLQAVTDALGGGEGRYVLKPQREGGGYNFYGDRLASKLRDNVEEQESNKKLKLGEKLAEFILMERLFPPRQIAILLRSGRVEGTGESISELGSFGVIVANSDGDILHNEYAGFLLRTKFKNVDEGGVASGFATLSSPFLC